MGEDPASLILLEEEREGEQVGSDDFVFRRIGESVPLFPIQSGFDLQSVPFKPLAVSDRFGALFIAHSEGFMVVKTKDAIDLAKDVKEKEGNGRSLKDLSLVDVQIGRVSLLEMSSDSSLLATVIGGNIRFFSVPSLLKKDQKPVFSCSLSKSGVVKDFKWLNKEAKTYIVLSDNGLLYQGDFKGEMKDVLDSVDAIDCSPDGKTIALVRKNNLSIFSLNFEEILRMPLTFKSWPDSETIKMDSIGWVRDDSIILGATQLNDNQEEEGYSVQVITSGDKNFFESSCKPVAFSFPDLFEGLADYIIPSGFGPHLLLSYLERWGVLLASNKKNIDQHVLLLKWSLNEGKNEVVSLEFQNDKYIPRIDLQENNDDNTIVGFGVEKVSLFEKITIQSGTDVQELAPQYIMACLTCEGKLIMYHIARASEPSELPQHDISDYEEILENDLVASDSKQSDVNNTQVSLTELAELATGEEELEAKNHNQVKMSTPQSVPTITATESKIPETKILENKIPENKIPNEASSPFKSRFTITETKAQTETTSPFKGAFGFNSQVQENKEQTQTTSPFKGILGSNTQATESKEQNQTSSPFKLTLGSNTQATESKEQKQTSSPLKGGFGSGTQNAPTMQPFGQSSTASETSPFKLDFGSGTQNAPTMQPFGQSSTASETSPFKLGFGSGTQSAPTMQPFGTPTEITSPFKGGFGSTQPSLNPFSTVDSTQKEGSKPFGTNSTPQKEGFKPIGTVDSAQKGGFKPFGTDSTPQKEGFKPYSGPSLKLKSPIPNSDGCKTSENKLSFNFAGENKGGFGSVGPKQNADKKPGNFEEEISVRNVVKPAIKGEKESEQDKLYSVKDMTDELDNLFSAIEKEVRFTSQQNILSELDQNLKILSNLSRKCKNNVEEQLEMMQDLRDKTSQVSSRQLYMESIVNQSSDKRYWDVWNSQKLPSEFEIKKQNILKANQNLTSHLVELERHFNSLEIKEFGEANRVGFNRRNNSTRSKPTQSLHSVYNTLNSQMATAEQLSECLSKQISLLKIASSPSPSPPVSKRVGSVKKLLFESIGLSYEPDNSYRSPDFPKSGPGSSSVKTKTFSESKKGSDLHIQSTTRRRRDSLDRSWSSVEPQKTTVKRIPSGEKPQPSSQKRFSIGSDKKFKSNKEIIKREMEPVIARQTESFAATISSPFLESSVSKFNPPTQDEEEKSPKQEASTVQQSSVFKWARASSPQKTEPKPQQTEQNKPSNVTHEPPKFPPFGSPTNSTAQTSSLFPRPNNVLSHSTKLDAKSQTGQPAFGFKTGEDSFKPSVFNFSLSSTSAQSTDAISSTTKPSIFGKSTEPTLAKPSPSIFGKRVESEGTTSKPPPSIFGKPAEQEASTKDRGSTETTVPTFESKPILSIFGNPKEPKDKTSPETVPSLSKTVPSLFQQSTTEKPVQVPVPTTFPSSPPKPVPTTFPSSPSKPVPTVSSPPKPVPTTSFSPPKPVPTTSFSPPKPVPTTLSFSPPKSVPTTVSSPSKPVPTTVPSPLLSLQPTSSIFSSPVQAPTPSSGPTLQPSTTSSIFSSPVQATPQKEDEDEMEEEATSQLNLSSLSGFGFGSGSGPGSASNQPKPNPFGPNLFNNTSSPAQTLTSPTLTPSPAQTLNSPSLTPNPNQLFRPASLSFPSSQPSPPASSASPFSGSGFGQPAQVGSGFGQPAQVGSGFGQPAQVGSGFGQPAQVNSGGLGFGQPAQVGSGGLGFGQPSQVGSGGLGFGQPAQIGGGQVLGSVLGSFGQSRQFGAGFGSSTGSSPALSSGGFGGFASAATGGGFAAAATGGGFAAAATGGGFAGAAPGGGFGGFGGAGQSGGFGGGGFGGVSNQGSGFSSFGGTGPGRPPAELFSQMRK